MALDKTKLVKLLNLISSDSDGEALTAARLALKLVVGADESWESVVGGTAKDKGYEGDNSYNTSYSKGYRAGFKKAAAAAAKGWARATYTPHLRRRPSGNLVNDRRKIAKIFEDFFSVWGRLRDIEKVVIAEMVDFFNANQCLYLRDYDTLKGITKKYWGVYD